MEFKPVVQASIPKGYQQRRQPKYYGVEEAEPVPDVKPAGFVNAAFADYWTKLQGSVSGKPNMGPTAGAAAPQSVAAARPVARGGGGSPRATPPPDAAAAGALAQIASAMNLRQLLTKEDAGRRSESTLNQVEAHLAGMEFFRDIPRHAVRLLAQRMRSEKYNPQQVVFNERDMGGTMYVITAGGVEIRQKVVTTLVADVDAPPRWIPSMSASKPAVLHRTVSAAEEATQGWEERSVEEELLHLYGPLVEILTVGQVVDEMALIKIEPRAVSAVASRALGCQVVAIDKDMYETMLDQPGNMLFIPRRYKEILLVPGERRSAPEMAIMREMLQNTKHMYLQDLPTAVAALLCSTLKMVRVIASEYVVVREDQMIEAVAIVIKGHVDVFRRINMIVARRGSTVGAIGSSEGGAIGGRRGSVLAGNRRGSVLAPNSLVDGLGGTVQEQLMWQDSFAALKLHNTPGDSDGGHGPPAGGRLLSRQASMKPGAAYGERVGVMNTGESFGERIVQAGGRSHSTFVAPRGTELLLIPRETFRSILAALGEEVVDASDIARVLRTRPGERPADEIDTLERLTRNNGFLKQLQPRVRRMVLQRAFYQRVLKDEPVFVEGQKGDCFYILLRGTVTMHERPRDGKARKGVDYGGAGGGGGGFDAPVVARGGPIGLDASEKKERAELIEDVLMGRITPDLPTSGTASGAHPRSANREASIRLQGRGPSPVPVLRPASKPAAEPAHASLPSPSTIDFHRAKGEGTGVDIEGRYGTRLLTLGAGGSFGEIALLANVGRTATVVARTNIQLMVVSKEDYMSTLKAVQELEFQEKVNFLQTVGPLRSWPANRLQKLCLSLHSHMYDVHATVVAQGAAPTEWYIIREGTVKITTRVRAVPKRVSVGSIPIEKTKRPYQLVDLDLGMLGPGDSFGDWSLLYASAQPVSLRVTSSTAEIYVLKGADFTRLLTDDSLAEAKRMAAVQRAWERERHKRVLATRGYEEAEPDASKKGALIHGHGPMGGPMPQLFASPPRIVAGPGEAPDAAAGAAPGGVPAATAAGASAAGGRASIIVGEIRRDSFALAAAAAPPLPLPTRDGGAAAGPAGREGLPPLSAPPPPPAGSVPRLHLAMVGEEPAMGARGALGALATADGAAMPGGMPPPTVAWPARHSKFDAAAEAMPWVLEATELNERLTWHNPVQFGSSLRLEASGMSRASGYRDGGEEGGRGMMEGDSGEGSPEPPTATPQLPYYSGPTAKLPGVSFLDPTWRLYQQGGGGEPRPLTEGYPTLGVDPAGGHGAARSGLRSEGSGLARGPPGGPRGHAGGGALYGGGSLLSLTSASSISLLSGGPRGQGSKLNLPNVERFAPRSSLASRGSAWSRGRQAASPVGKTYRTRGSTPQSYREYVGLGAGVGTGDFGPLATGQR